MEKNDSGKAQAGGASAWQSLLEARAAHSRQFVPIAQQGQRCGSGAVWRPGRSETGSPVLRLNEARKPSWLRQVMEYCGGELEGPSADASLSWER